MGYLALCLLLLLLLFILELRPVLVSHAASLCEEGDGWALDWAEDFAGDALNLTRWSVHTGSGDSLARLSTATHENVYVQGGRLVLRSRRETANVSIAGQVYNYSTGAVTSLGKVSFAPPFRLCVVARLPGAGGGPNCTCPDGLQLSSDQLEGCPGKGIWPAHWLMPDVPNATCCWAGDQSCCTSTCSHGHAEIDVMEMLNSDGVLHATYHSGSDCTANEAKSGYRFVGSNWGEKDHEYAVEVGADYVAFALDGGVYTNISAVAHSIQHGGRWANYSTTGSSGFWRWPYYILLNTALGFQPNNPDNPDEHTVLPQYHSIDSVRVMRPKTGG